MPDWAIVLVAAFGGGLAGAVLQPVVTYAMDRLRSKERIQKSRERALRRMVMAVFNACPRDPSRLEGDSHGIPCESLRQSR